MTYLFVGAGQAGSAIVDAIFDHTDDALLDLFSTADISTLGRPIVFNSTIRDLNNLTNVPREQQFGIAEQHGLVEGTEPGFEEMVTGGFGRNPVKANDVMDEHATQLHEVLDEQVGAQVPEDEDLDVPPESTDSIQFAFLFLGLGGGTGCGIAPHLAREIKAYTDDRAQVIAIGVLPASGEDGEESAAGRQAWNARYGLERLEPTVDGIVLVDNERISYLDSAAGQFSQYNEYVAAAWHDLIAGPMFNTVDPSEVDGIDTPDIDVRDIVTSLSFGVGTADETPGYAAIGRSVTMTQSLSGYLLPYLGKQDVDSAALSRLSTSKQTVARLDPADAQKAIALVRAPASYIGNGGKRIETSTILDHLEQSAALNEVNLGVAINERKLASVTTLLTYQRSDIRRLDEIEAAADAYEDETEQLT